jgi:hypothetical protein
VPTNGDMEGTTVQPQWGNSASLMAEHFLTCFLAVWTSFKVAGHLPTYLIISLVLFPSYFFGTRV